MQPPTAETPTAEAAPASRQPVVQPGLGTAIKRGWWLVVLLAIVLGGAGAGLALHRHAKYEATTRLTVANVSFQTQSIPGFTSAVQSLAGSYAQTVVSPAVLGRVARQERTTVNALAHVITSSPVPESTLFTIKATQPSAVAAVNLVNATARSAQAYIATLDDSSARAKSVFARYRRYAALAADAQQHLDNLRAEKAADKGSVSDQSLITAQTAVGAATVKSTAASQQYQQIITSDPGGQARAVAILSPAVSAASDRNTFLQRYILIGAVGGAAVGLLLALLLAAWRRRRTPSWLP